jgi:glutamyl-tRNA synthetase/glutamyl-Q tRNA(Asp) synthetase
MTTEQSGVPGGLGRFAPSTTGRAHPGTFLAGLLCWLDARSRGAPVVLRLEDLDLDRTKAGYVDDLRDDLAWFGLDWDHSQRQSDATERHADVIESLVAEGRVYACECSRAKIKATGRRAPDESYRYPGTCRSQRVTAGTWRDETRTLRLDLPETQINFRDESGAALVGDAAALYGDPILRRRDGAYAYHFASVVDDADAGVGHVVRGRDLLPSTLLQVALQRALGFPTPSYRHHSLLLERRGEKLSKLHGAVDARALRERYDAKTLCGMLANFVGLVPAQTRCDPSELVSGFDWDGISSEDVVLAWSGDAGLCVVENP